MAKSKKVTAAEIINKVNALDRSELQKFLEALGMRTQEMQEFAGECFKEAGKKPPVVQGRKRK